MKLRIKYIEGIGHFAQVKHGVFSGWKTIGKHLSGFGLYPDEHIDYPLSTQFEAQERAKLYQQWSYNGKSEPKYFDV